MSEWWHFILGGVVMVATFRGLDALDARMRRRRATRLPALSDPKEEQNND